MSEKESVNKEEVEAKGKTEGISRRDFAKTSVAAGVAAVAVPGTLRSEVASQIMPATGKAHPAAWAHGRTVPAEYYLDESRYLAAA